MTELFNQIAQDCRKATLLIEKGQFRRLTLKEEQSLAFHLQGCGLCRDYRRQSLLIDQLAGRFTRRPLVLQMSKSAKKQLEAVIVGKFDQE